MRKSLLFLTGLAVAGGIALAVPASAQTAAPADNPPVISNGISNVISNAVPANGCHQICS
ncbi:MAG TPA: hypothetical protein VHZ97_05050 [Pseudonocardiaceae bacterium]|jgi:hypothetical protein|nr:hypothetical protein [Pseudonocardiaceae bacterium]